MQVDSRGERDRVARPGRKDPHDPHKPRPEPGPHRQRRSARRDGNECVGPRADGRRHNRAQHVRTAGCRASGAVRRRSRPGPAAHQRAPRARPVRRAGCRPSAAVRRRSRLGHAAHDRAPREVRRGARAPMTRPPRPHRPPSCSRREFIAATLAAPVATTLARDWDLAGRAPSPGVIRVASPSGSIEFQLFPDDRGPLSYAVTFRNRNVVERSGFSMLLDGVELGQGAKPGKVEAYEGNERYAWRGVHSEAVNRFKGARIPLRHGATGTDYVLDVRAFDDGVAFRSIVPGSGPRVPDEATTFVVPAGSTVWYHDLRGHYEGVHAR